MASLGLERGLFLMQVIVLNMQIIVTGVVVKVAELLSVLVLPGADDLKYFGIDEHLEQLLIE